MKNVFYLSLILLFCACAADSFTMTPPEEPEPEAPWAPNEFCVDPDSLTGCRWLPRMTNAEVRELMTGTFHEYHFIGAWTGVDTIKPCGVVDSSRVTLDFREDGSFRGTLYDEVSEGTWSVGWGNYVDADSGMKVTVTQESGNIFFYVPSRVCDDNFYVHDSRNCCDGQYILYYKVVLGRGRGCGGGDEGAGSKGHR